jgi:hypothetical protein
MSGSESKPPRCNALIGRVGFKVSCSIYQSLAFADLSGTNERNPASALPKQQLLFSGGWLGL